MRGGDELGRRGRVDWRSGTGLEPLPGLPEPHREGRELSLRSVMQVSLDPTERGRRLVDRPGPRHLEMVHPFGEPARTEEAPGEPSVHRGDASRYPWGGEKHRDPH